MQIAPPRTSLRIEDLGGAPKRRRRDRLMKVGFTGAGFVSIIISAAIVLSLLGGAIEFLSKVDLGALFADSWYPRRDTFGLPTIVAGTLLVSFIAILVAAPLGLCAAMYLAEYASRRSRRFLKPIMETLASIPSVVIGFFALRVISPGLVQKLFDTTLFNFLAAGIGVGLLVTPLVASVAEDAMHAVPQSLREASVGLGARKMTTTLRVVFPAAISGITAALILGISRAVGETMVVAIAAGGTGGAEFTVDPLASGQTMTAAMTSLATGSDQVQADGPAYASLFFVGLLLFVMTLGLNMLSERFVRRIRGKH